MGFSQTIGPVLTFQGRWEISPRINVHRIEAEKTFQSAWQETTKAIKELYRPALEEKSPDPTPKNQVHQPPTASLTPHPVSPKPTPEYPTLGSIFKRDLVAFWTHIKHGFYMKQACQELGQNTRKATQDLWQFLTSNWSDPDGEKRAKTHQEQMKAVELQAVNRHKEDVEKLLTFFTPEINALPKSALLTYFIDTEMGDRIEITMDSTMREYPPPVKDTICQNHGVISTEPRMKFIRRAIERAKNLATAIKAS